MDKRNSTTASVWSKMDVFAYRYAQSGMSWMLGVFQRCIPNGDKAVLATQCHTAILSDDSLQDADSVIAIIKSSLELFKRGHAEISEVFLRSDNAGEHGTFFTYTTPFY